MGPLACDAPQADHALLFWTTGRTCGRVCQGPAHGHGVHPVRAPGRLVPDRRVTGADGTRRLAGAAHRGWRPLGTRAEMELHGLLKLAGPLLRRRMQPMFKRDLDNIKARLEGAHAVSGTGTGEE